MVGAVVLARLTEDPELSQAFLQAAADSILPNHKVTIPPVTSPTVNHAVSNQEPALP